MKLHLPTGLRKSLLACLAALALPALPVTLSSASALLGGVAVLSFSASETQAADVIFNENHTVDRGESLTPYEDGSYFYAGECDNIILNGDGRIEFLDDSWTGYWVWIVRGTLSGSGNLTLGQSPLFNGGDLELVNGGGIDGKIILDPGEAQGSFSYCFYLGNNFSAEGIESNSNTPTSGFAIVRLNGSSVSTFTVNTNGKNVVHMGTLDVGNTGASMNFRKTGQGSQEIQGKATIYGALTVDGGMLRLLGGGSVSGSVSVNANAVLEVAMQADKGDGTPVAPIELNSTAVALNGGTLKFSGVGGSAGTPEVEAGRLSVGPQGGRIEWTEEGTAENSGLSLIFAGLSSTIVDTSQRTDLNIAAMTKTSQNIFNRVNVGNITNFNGTLTADTGSGENNRFEIGLVSLEDGYTTNLNVAGKGVYAEVFHKQGGGTLLISGGLTVSGELYMDYEGEFGMQSGNIVVRSQSILRYGTGRSDHLLALTVSSLEGFADGNAHFDIDIDDVDDDLLRAGINMGISGEAMDMARWKSVFSLLGYDDNETDWEIQWNSDDRNFYLYVDNKVAEAVNENWDEAWGNRERRNAPSAEFLDGKEYKNDGSSKLGGFYDNCFELAAHTEYNSPTQTFVRLVEGGSRYLEGDGGRSGWTKASVFGGRVYNAEATGDTWVNMDKGSYISMKEAPGKTVRYHLLVGGSSCLYVDSTPNSGMGPAFGGFIGNSHIQVDGGTVDYIVGGNHVNNTAFTFIGDSYISFKKGVLNGGIVGGSTLTKGSANSSVYAFQGDSNIFIYTVLTGTSAEAPRISDQSRSEDGMEYDVASAAFGAIVGGNAWINLAESSGNGIMNPTFRGTSTIVVDLADYRDTDNPTFEKLIVGGNYTAIAGTETGSTNRSTTFNAGGRETLSTITVITPEPGTFEVVGSDGQGGTMLLQDDVKFTGGINGASRRSSMGAGETRYTGSTRVSLTGGIYTNYIAGGMWFDERANGAHQATLNGNTSVEINRGTFWRVIGASISLGGDGESSENHTGNSTVLIRGGHFGVEHTELYEPGSEMLSQQQMSFVTGGSFYRNNYGGTGMSDGNTHTGDAMVVIEASAAGVVMSGAHVVGGDYVNASGSGNHILSTINGTSGVTIGKMTNNEGMADISGLVVGGSWLTDTGTDGTVSVTNTSVNIYHGNIAKTPVRWDVLEPTPGQDGVSGHYHRDIAVVGGSVLIDEDVVGGGAQTTGSHNAEVTGTTSIVIGVRGEDGPTITGHVVGGSYATCTNGVNELSTNSVDIRIHSGSIKGDVYGGHYTENEDTPDSLKLNSARILMDGGLVEGNIVGGGMRATGYDYEDEESATSQQGRITIELLGGTLRGNVYAAGYDSAISGSAYTHTDSTLVKIGGDFVITPSSTGHVIISGGYGRPEDMYTLRGSVGSARLEILANNSSLNNNRDRVLLQDFDAVSVANGVKVALETELIVLRAKDGESPVNSFTKDGAGSLSVKSLKMWNIGDNATEDYLGRIAVNGGSLKLTDSAKAQSVAGGLAFNLNSLAGHTSKESAYLQSAGGLVLGLTGAAGDKVSLDLAGDIATLAAVDYGTYYLATGLEEGVNDENFDYDIEALSEALADSNRFLEVRVIDNSLLLLVRDTAENGFFHWDGTDSHVWTETRRDAWQESATGESPAGHNVYFDNSGIEGRVEVSGDVTPRSVWVQSGSYTFVGTNGALNIGANGGNKEDLGSDGQPIAGQLGEGELAVGGRGRDASLTLEVGAKRIDTVMLKERGTLNLNHKDAITDKTIIVFEGGVLGYGVGAQSPFMKDVSGNVSLYSSAAVRVNVVSGASVSWGGEDAQVGVNGGITTALRYGIEKGGDGDFSLAWTDDQKRTMTSRISVADGGALTLTEYGSANAAQLILSAEGGDLVTEGTLTLAAAKNAHISVDRKFGGDGSIVLDSQASENKDSCTFVLTSNNKDFKGEIELRGQGRTGVADSVQISTGAALGGADSTLVLSGMHIVFAPGYTPSYNPDDKTEKLPDIDVRLIHVDNNTVNYIGGSSYNAENAELLISGTLRGSGNASLSNAWGSSVNGFHHTFVGNAGSFAGLIVAGDLRSVSNAAAVGVSNSTWTLTDVDGGDMLASFAGGGRIIINHESTRATRLLGKIGSAEAGNTTSLENIGTSELVIASEENTATGALVTRSVTMDEKTPAGRIRLGDNDKSGVWGGSELQGDGEFVLTNGALTAGISSKSTKASLIVQTTVVNSNNPNISTKVDIGGTQGSLLDGIDITAGGQLAGVGGDLNLGYGLTSTGVGVRGVTAHLMLGRDNVGTEATTTEEDHLIVMKGGNVIVNNADDFKLDFTNDAFMEVITQMIESGSASGEAWLHIVAGGNLVMDPSMYTKILAISNDADDANGALLSVLGFKVTGVKGGDLGVSGNTEQIYVVLRDDVEGDLGDSPLVTSYGVLGAYKATAVAAGKRLTVNLTGKPRALELDHTNEDQTALEKDVAAGGAIINNLLGAAGSSLVVNNGAWLAYLDDVAEAERPVDPDMEEDDERVVPVAPDFTDPANRVKVLFDNSAYADVRGDENWREKAKGINTLFEGTITGTEGVDFEKTGKGTLTIGSASHAGGLYLQNGDMRLSGGGLTLQGSENKVNSITFGYTEEADAQERRALTLQGRSTQVGSIIEDGAIALERKGGDIVLENGAELSLTNKSYLVDTVIMQGAGDIGTLSIENGALLTLSGLPEEDAVIPAAAELTSVPNQLVDVNLKIKSGGVLDMALSHATVHNLSGSGTLEGSGGSLDISGAGSGVFSGSMTGAGLVRVLADGGSLTFKDAVGGTSWAVENAGKLTIDLMNNQRNLTLGNVTLKAGSETHFIFDTDMGSSMKTLEANILTVEKDAKVKVSSTGREMLTEREITLAHVAAIPSRSSVENTEVELSGVAFLHWENTGLRMKGDSLVLGLKKASQNDFITEGMHKNSLAGAVFFWEASDTETSEHWARIAKDPDSDMYKMVESLVMMKESGQTDALNRTLAAGAGASVAVLGSALSQDLERQLRAIRNRTTTMGGEHRYDGNDELPLYHMWINGEGAYHKMSADGFAPGYTLNSWGGTVGVDADVSENATVGLAVSAMYGDLKASAADTGRGDMTTTYLSGFARASAGAWMHTFIVTAGLSDVKLNRTVNYGAGAYNTGGRTNGYQVGALYEIGYAHALNQQGTKVLQGVANVEVRHASLGSYSEGSSDAALSVDKITHTVITFGVGARLQSIVAENALNRASLFEARALVKADVGDRSSTANNALVYGSGTRQELESAKLGAVGLEIGAGLTVPVGQKGSFFVDASAELRSGYTDMNANVGYRLSF